MRRNPVIFSQYLDMRRSLDADAVARLKTWIEWSHAISLSQGQTSGNIEKQWKDCIDDDVYWNTMIEGVVGSRFFKLRGNCILLQMEVCYFANMYIMRSDLLEEYLTFCFEVLAFCRSRLDLGERALGYFSERLFTFWLYQKRIENPMLRILELPFVMYHPPLNQETTGETATAKA